MDEARLEIEYVSTESLVPYAKNAKKHPRSQVEQIANSIQRFGMCDPVGVWTDENGDIVIVEGHGRVLALELLDEKQVPIIRLDHLSDDERRAYALAHNQLTMSSDWDDDLLFDEMDDLDFDWNDFGFDIEGAKLDAETSNDVEEVPIPDDVETRAKSGDIWVLGEHRLVCGDSTDPLTVAALMGDEFASIVITDPPYNVAYEGATKKKLTIKNDSMNKDDFFEFLSSAFSTMADAMAPGAYFYVFHSDSWRVTFQTALERNDLLVRQNLIWVKNTLVLGRQDYQWRHEPILTGWKGGGAHYFTDSRAETTVIEDEAHDFDSMSPEDMRALLKSMYAGDAPTTALFYNKPARNAEHPTMKPIDLVARLMCNSSRVNDIVLDPFGGSGSTLIAAEQCGRKCRMIELDPVYCDVILSRWESISGDKPELIGSMFE